VNLLHPKVFFRSDRFNQQNFYATKAALNFAMMAYNFISLFRQVVLGQKIHQQRKHCVTMFLPLADKFLKTATKESLNYHWP
jgi:hypothetical protein